MKSLARILSKDKMGAISPSGEVVIPAVYDYMGEFRFGYSLAVFNGRPGFVDSEGCFTPAERPVDDIIGENLISSKDETSGLLGLRTLQGEEITREIFSDINRMSEDLIVVNKNGYWGALNKNGDLKVEMKYLSLTDFSSGLAVACGADGREGFINASGDIVIDFRHWRVYEFHDGLAAVDDWDTGKSGFIDTTGEVVTGLNFDLVKRFSEGVAPAYINGKCGFIDRNGVWIIEPKFMHCSPFFEGLAGASNDYYERTCGFINKLGEWVVMPHYDVIETFQNGICLVHGIDPKTEERYSAYIDKSGILVWGPGDSWWP
jgi:hypothetical protein